MKKVILYPFLFLLSLVFVFVFVSCQKEDLPEIEPLVQLEESTSPSALIDQSILASTAKPDLVARIITNVTAMTDNCGHVIPDVSCYGQHSFRAAAIVYNNGSADLPAGELAVEWTTNNGDPRIQTVAHNGIAVGHSIRVSRGFDLGPCDCGNPPAMSFQAIFFGARVDPNNRIPEENEHNNSANPFLACNGC